MLRDAPIRRKLTLMVLMTSGLALLLTGIGFFTTQLITSRQTIVRQLDSLSAVIATNSTAALAFNDPKAGNEILAAFQAVPNVIAAGLYDGDGGLFASYPSPPDLEALPDAPGEDNWHSEGGYLVGTRAVVQGDSRLGTLVLKFDLSVVYDQLKVYGLIAAGVMGVAMLAAYLLSRILQQQVSQPILQLARTARAVSERRDFSVRAASHGRDEVGLLTDAFNQMLAQLQTQHEALQESETRVRAVLNSALSAVIVMDSNGLIVDWNTRAEAMFERTREQAIGQELAAVIVPPAQRDAHRRGLAHYRSSGEGPILNRPLETSALRPDGSEFPAEISISPMKSGDTVNFCGFITDITERKQIERRIQGHLGRLDLLHRITRAIGDRQDLNSIFRVVLQNLEDNLPVDFGCVFLYDAAAEMLTVASTGAASAALAEQLDMREQTQVPIDANGLSRCVRGELVYEPDVRPLPFAFPQRLAGGGLLSLVISPLLAESQVFGVLVAARRKANSFSSGDCEFLRQLSEHVALASHQAQLHAALQEAYDDLRQTQKTVMQQERLRALGQMASGVAHDINNAISPVALYTESLLEREPHLSERARHYLTTIQRSIEDVAETVARMREFYRPREPQLILTRVALNRLATQVIDLTRARWNNLPQERGFVISLKTELAADLPEIMGAESEIRDALTNLIFNAVDAMPEGGTLTIRTRAADSEPAPGSEPQRLAQLEVIDTGVGMDEQTRRHCLEPFYTTKGERGTGLGLAMVYGMIQRHGAELEIESEVGVGTTVRIEFSAVAAPGAPAMRLPTQPGGMRRLRILIVDDDPIIVESLREILENDGHLVAAADGGRRGIELFTASCATREPFAVVITDLGMPYVDGRQVAAEIKALSPATPVLLLTGWGQRLLAENDAPPHVDRVLNKPPKLRELRQALAELVPATSE